MLKLKANERVLDVGCGIGGGDFLMAGKYDVFCHGVDLSVNMVLLALERASQAKKSKVRSSASLDCSHQASEAFLCMSHLAKSVAVECTSPSIGTQIDERYAHQ